MNKPMTPDEFDAYGYDATVTKQEAYRDLYTKHQRLVEAATAYFDQLCSFNDVRHPEVHRRRLELRDVLKEVTHERE
jgi:hypothetical protein